MDIFAHAEYEAGYGEHSSDFVAGMLMAIRLIKKDFQEVVDSSEWAPAC